MSSTEIVAPLSEVEEGVRWAATRYHVRLDRVILAEIIARAEKKRADEKHPLGVHEAKRDAIKEIMTAFPHHKRHRDKYSSTVGHIYGLRAAAKRAAEDKKNEPAAKEETSSDAGAEVYTQIAARNGERD